MDDHESTTLVIASEPSFPGYTTIRELGAGGMARVYLAREESLDRLVAVKVMNQDLLSKDFLDRFDIEAKIAAKFRHPNIVGVFASGEFDGRPYIAFEYAPGGTLEERLVQRDGESSLPELDALQIAHKLAQALAYLHERKIIHRDLKPANIVFNEDDEPLLSDFGIAKALETDADLTQPGHSIGSPRYMSPEQLRGEQISDKSDIYSFGLLLLQMLHGRLIPVDAEKVQALELGRCTKLVASCLATNPAQRPSARACVAQLEKAIRDASGLQTTTKLLLGALCTAIVGLAVAYVVLPKFVTTEDVATSTAGTLIGDSTPSGSMAGGSILVDPEYASVSIDGQQVVPTGVQLVPGWHDVLAVAPGYSGYFARVKALQGTPIDIQLEPLSLPTLVQFRAFHQIFDEVGSDKLARPSIGYPLYDRLLAIQSNLVGRQPNSVISAEEFPDLEALRQLALAGDADAQVGVFLLASEQLGNFDQDVAVTGLRDASSNGGFALASYYRALTLRQTAAVAGTIDRTTKQQLVQFMRLALDQGLEYAAAELQLIEQLKTNS